MSLEPVMPPYNASDPSATFVSTSCFDFLLIEMVPLAKRLGGEGRTRHFPAFGALASRQGGGEDEDEEEERSEEARFRLEALGYRVGQGLVERFSKDRPRFNGALDIIKFLCKDIWSLVFGKNIDNLKTNHRGVYVLTDNVFRPFSRMSTEAGGQAVIRAQPFLWFPCGIVRGSLAALGMDTAVQAEIITLPAAVFQIKTLPAKA
ncbi:hypothetical protein L249_5323 [Ophiocordyceps polyrhachis-furcata BCC 54312]|uniref:Trafficking protein particle complex subunit 6B n=1 Tax=Ophiocordyceps polyrhachis-furcata BCC 54312 TaxID=1330021 RepID=A0A367L8Z3_9HYPO|nr:hypothetical protein L249_5323 [Ophiocordyceps polyrhachis-furcata BCC 54312]